MNYPLHMFNYHVWANRTLLGHIGSLPAEVMTREVNSSYPTIAHAFTHIYLVDTMWLQVLQGIGMQEALEASMPLLAQTQHYTVEQFDQALEQLAERYRALLAEQPDLEREIVLVNPFATTRSTRLSEMLLHVANHGTYHRGNVSTMLRQLGHPSTMTDYMLYWYQPSESANS